MENINANQALRRVTRVYNVLSLSAQPRCGYPGELAKDTAPVAADLLSGDWRVVGYHQFQTIIGQSTASPTVEVSFRKIECFPVSGHSNWPSLRNAVQS